MSTIFVFKIFGDAKEEGTLRNSKVILKTVESYCFEWEAFIASAFCDQEQRNVALIFLSNQRLDSKWSVV